MNKIDLACIIDDDPIYVFGIKRLMKLTKFSDNFMVCNNGQEALDSLNEKINSGVKLPDVILLDLNMPIIDGWQFLDEFTKKTISQKITIYIVSSSVDPKDVLKAKAYQNVSDYVVKPITESHLKDIMNDFKVA